jgi:hypothetical protein
VSQRYPKEVCLLCRKLLRIRRKTRLSFAGLLPESRTNTLSLCGLRLPKGKGLSVQFDFSEVFQKTKVKQHAEIPACLARPRELL